MKLSWYSDKDSERESGRDEELLMAEQGPDTPYRMGVIGWDAVVGGGVSNRSGDLLFVEVGR